MAVQDNFIAAGRNHARGALRVIIAGHGGKAACAYAAGIVIGLTEIITALHGRQAAIDLVSGINNPEFAEAFIAQSEPAGRAH